MKGNRNGSPGNARATRVFKLAPTAHAIRIALAGSATLLAVALAGTGTAYAGTCVNTAPASVSCDGAFTDTLPGTEFIPVVDMTLVLGENAPTSVVTAPGDIGVGATWAGNIGVVSHADITTVGADGIHVYGSMGGTGLVENTGSIRTSVTADGANAIDMNVYGDLTLNNSGDLEATGSSVFDVTTVTAYSVDGVTTVNNQLNGGIVATATDGNALGINAFGFQGTVVNNDGAIVGTSVNGTATGVFVEAFHDFTAGGTASVANGGSIDVTSAYSQAVGIEAYGNGTSVAIDNAGDITASGYDLATGISSYAAKATVIDNTGTINATASAGSAAGISAVSEWDWITIGNDGDIAVNAYDQAAGIASNGYYGYIDNTGSVHATSTNGSATGIFAQDYNESHITNVGDVQATSALYTATGVDSSTALLVDVANAGSITAVGDGGAVGVAATSLFSSHVDNDGTITATSAHGDASGVIATVFGAPSVYGPTVVDNAGQVTATSNNGDAVGIRIEADLPIGVAYNSGSVSATATHGGATGISVVTDASVSSSYVLNSGAVDAFAGDGGLAQGISAYANDGDAFVTNSGRISADAGFAGTAHGVMAFSQNGSATVTNTSVISAVSATLPSAQFITELDYAVGIYASAEDAATVTNSGSVTVEGGWVAIGVEVRADDGLVTVNNTATGVINVTGSRTASGMSTYVDQYGRDPFTNDAVMYNAGSISVTTTGEMTDYNGYSFIANAIGMEAYLWNGNSARVTNAGDITVDAAGAAWGVHADSVGEVSAANSGTITIAASGSSSSYGVEGNAVEGNTSVLNSGLITIQSENLAIGDVGKGLSGSTSSRSGGNATVVNTGRIVIDGVTTAFGMHADAGLLGAGTATASNTGNIQLQASGAAWGIDSDLWNFDGDTVISNIGAISATASDARGIRAGQLASAGDTLITNSGDIEAITQTSDVFGSYGSIGIFARRYSFDGGGIVDVVNNGSIRSIANIGDDVAGFRGAHAHGIKAFSYANDIEVTNAGSLQAALSATGEQAGSALGIFVKNGYAASFGDVGISNTGTIETSLVSSDTLSPYTSLYYSGAYTAGVHVRNTYGDVEVANAGSISASVRANDGGGMGLTRGSGISLLSQVGTTAGSTLALGELAVSNTATGAIRADAIAEYGDGDVFANGISATVTVGSAGADLASAGHGIRIDSAGAIVATTATGAAATGNVAAIGILALNGSAQGVVDVANAGTIMALATNSGTATATGVAATAFDVAVALAASGTVVASATGADGSATGLSISGSSVDASNAGVIQAKFVGAGESYGAHIASTTAAADFTNSGTIVALADAGAAAVGVQLDNLTATTLVNSGRITAMAGNTAGIAVRTGDSTDLIQNTGLLDGRLLTGAGDDTLDNGAAGTWRLAGASDFGAGDDTISNAGTILLEDAAIDMGGVAGGGNVFNNSGRIRVAGNNSIDLGAQNANAFSSAGTIDFRNGVATDRLTIVGNFAGGGAVNLDVDAARNASDLLYIGGNVAAGSTSTINVELLSLPTTATSQIQLVHVAGDSAANAFALGQVIYQPNQGFVDLNYDFGVQAGAEGSGDVFSLGVAALDVEVAGLSDAGTLAASMAAGVQSLLGSEVGTWRQRAGVIDQFRKGGVSLWGRLFGDSGKVSPGHVASNFGQGGNFAFDQRNSGTEVGADFAVSDTVSVGALLAKSNARQRLEGAGLGSSTIDGDTVGAYATWLSPTGFYVDASYRRMSFDAKLRTDAGEIRSSGDADAVSVETGYAWTLAGGLTVEPQLQYTRTQVDDASALPGALATFQSHGGDSSRGRAGVLVSKVFQANGLAWTPYASINAVREFDGKNAFSINGDFSGETSAEGTSALAEAGLDVQFGKLSIYGGASWQDGGSLQSVVGGQVGVRYAW